MSPKSTKSTLDLRVEEFFGPPPMLDSATSSLAIDEAVADAGLMGDIGIQIDPDLADEIGAEILSISDLELIQP